MNDNICEHCKQPRSKHALANFADGPMIGDAALICPTALFSEHRHRAIDLVGDDTSRLCACGATSSFIEGSEQWTNAERWTAWSKP